MRTGTCALRKGHDGPDLSIQLGNQTSEFRYFVATLSAIVVSWLILRYLGL